jgi:hypothetical protein
VFYSDKISNDINQIVSEKLDKNNFHAWKFKTYHGEWFRDVKNLEKPGHVKTGGDTAHPIAHIGNVPLAM